MRGRVPVLRPGCNGRRGRGSHHIGSRHQMSVVTEGRGFIRYDGGCGDGDSSALGGVRRRVGRGLGGARIGGCHSVEGRGVRIRWRFGTRTSGSVKSPLRLDGGYVAQPRAAGQTGRKVLVELFVRHRFRASVRRYVIVGSDGRNARHHRHAHFHRSGTRRFRFDGGR